MAATVTDPRGEQREEMGPDHLELTQPKGAARVTVYLVTPVVTEQEETQEEGSREVLQELIQGGTEGSQK